MTKNLKRHPAQNSLDSKSDRQVAFCDHFLHNRQNFIFVCIICCCLKAELLMSTSNDSHFTKVIKLLSDRDEVLH